MSESPKHRLLPSHPPSHIPVVAPRPTRSTLPSSLSLPQLNLAPSLRRPSVSNSVAGTPSPTTSSAPQAGSSMSSFRSLRNLLPFGAGKQALSGSTNCTPNIPKGPFPNFGSVRRSMTGERKNSASFSRLEPPDVSPIISIEFSPQHTDSQEGQGTYINDSRSNFGNGSPASRRSTDASRSDCYVPTSAS